jgi:hypothetical protein
MLINSPAGAEDFTRWKSLPAKFAPASVTPQAATLQGGEWSYLVSPSDFANVEVGLA